VIDADTKNQQRARPTTRIDIDTPNATGRDIGLMIDDECTAIAVAGIRQPGTCLQPILATAIDPEPFDTTLLCVCASGYAPWREPLQSRVVGAVSKSS